jgi:Ser/Thr protein kinase RdoA (MazF antagonist)
MELKSQAWQILKDFGLAADKFSIEKIGSGHINFTFKIEGPQEYVLQLINKNVFKNPEIIANNLRLAADYLNINYPDYLFLSPIKTVSGGEMTFDHSGNPWRLFPYIPGTITLDKVDTIEQAFEAARGFGELTRKLDGIDETKFAATIPKFQDLTWRFEQLQTALKNTTDERKKRAADAISKAMNLSFLAEDYLHYTSGGILKTRIVHNDTKINNILFHAQTQKAVCVIDLDTLMPGYFIYDLGDMVRTFVSPVGEGETDLSKVDFRKSFYDAMLEGYRSQMNECLSEAEAQVIPFAGMMMTYIMAIRFLADFLNGNIYYQIHYPEENLDRANNQLRLVELIGKALNYKR